MPEDIVPYPDIEDNAPITDSSLALQKHNAEWARTFQGGTTNLAQRSLRAKHASDIDTYNESLAAQRAQMQQRGLQTDKKALDYYVQTKKMAVAEMKQRAEMSLAQQRADAAERMAPYLIESRQAETRAKLASIESNAKQAAAQAKIAEDAARVRGFVADAMPHVAPDQLDEVYHAAAMQFPGAVHDKDIGPQIKSARENRQRRQLEAEKASAPKTGKVDPYANLSTQQKSDVNVLQAALKSLEEQVAAGSLTANNDANVAKLNKDRAAIIEKLDAVRGGGGAPPAASQFKEGETRTKGNVTYKRDANGVWHPQP